MFPLNNDYSYHVLIVNGLEIGRLWPMRLRAKQKQWGSGWNL